MPRAEDFELPVVKFKWIGFGTLWTEKVGGKAIQWLLKWRHEVTLYVCPILKPQEKSLQGYIFDFFQGFNRIVAIALLFMHEEDAFWCLVFIIEHLMPPEYFR